MREPSYVRGFPFHLLRESHRRGDFVWKWTGLIRNCKEDKKQTNCSLSHLVHLLEGLVRVLLVLVRPVVDILLVANGTRNLLLGTLVQ